MIVYLDVDDLMEIASVVLGDVPQVRDPGLLSSAVVRPATVAFGQEAYPELWSKAAALLHSVCMNHALIDGNKRLAWAAARVFLALNEVPVRDVDVDQAESLVMAVASGAMTEVPDIARELRKLYV
ncbi:type II toxin-antitoxin system death-on-curing family toxin [Micromonospora haikouensis]|uniref:type II toxin-antitoxin system death-on-curing family toxin n=1 Tax=Micromonospora haikouensis TaxID=686309 RepID=UPI003D7188D0